MSARVPEALGGMRLDQALARLFPQYSRNRLQAWLKSGHLTLDGKRLYVTNSATSSLDYSPRYALRLIHVGPDGKMKQDPFFNVDFSQAPNGPARPHDMLLN